MGLKANTIRMILCRKYDAWVNSIEDVELKAFVKDKGIITGGCIANMLLGEKVKDYDVYFTDMEAAARVAKYYVERFNKNAPTAFARNWRVGDIKTIVDNGRVRIMVKSAGVASEDDVPDYQYFEQLDTASPETEEFVEQVMAVKEQDGVQEDVKAEKGKFRPVFLSSNAITLSDKVQLIIRFYGDATAIHKNFDFVHCTNYWTSADRRLHLVADAMECLLAKELRYIGSLYPLCSMIRVRKFVERGFRINAGQFLKMAMQLSEMNLRDPEVLEEQLTGVDAAYFAQMLRLLRDHDPTQIDAAYVVKLVDRMF